MKITGKEHVLLQFLNSCFILGIKIVLMYAILWQTENTKIPISLGDLNHYILLFII